MSNDNWNRIKEIVDGAIRRKPGERTSFLNEACGGNDSIRREVESLLSSFERADDFMEEPAFEAVTEQLHTLNQGQVLGHYEIVRRLGEGGMGVVYLGRDTTLDRLVAIKVLNKKFERNEDNVRRFIREAKAASALNHPNILTIFEIGEHEGSQFIVSEYIEGRTLREVMRSEKLKPPTVADIAGQIAGALAAAHKARIVHRDLKPENVIVRDDGYVKVLDFGLAKLLSGDGQPIAGIAGTEPSNTTASGIILGTVNYMSPEQAKGKKVDERTDIFSLGVVLYEMITGRAPFAGDSVAETFANLIDHEPEPMTAYAADVPDKLQHVVSRMLAKDPDERYPSAAEVISDLRAFRGGDAFPYRYRPSDRAGDLETTPKGDHRSTGALENDTERGAGQAGITEVVAAGDAHATKQTSLVRRMRGSRGVIFAALLVGVAVVLGIGAWAILRRGDTSSQKISTVAVLPFRPIDSGSRDESLEMGVTETLITRLGSIGQITVRPLNSVKKFAESDVDPIAAGQESQADSVLTGSLQKAGDRIRVNVRLVDVKTGGTLWSDKFDETFTDIFKVQDAIAERAANALKLKLSASDRERLAKRYTDNPEAYQLYLQGRSLYHRRLGNWSDESMGFYTRALEKDPNFALAHVALADLLVSRHFTNKNSYDETMPQVKEHLAKALQLDNALAEAYSLSGAVKYQYEYDWDGAGSDFRRAVELDPGSSQVRLDYAFFLLSLARFNEAFTQLDKAQEIEPDSLTIKAVRGNFLWHAHHDDEAIKYLEDFTKVVPDRGSTYFTLSHLYRNKGRDADAIEALLRGLQLRSRPQDEINHFAEAYRQGGWKALSRFQIANMTELSRTQPMRPIDFAIAYASNGDNDNAFKFLEKAIEEHEPLVAQCKVNPLMDPLRDDPRFTQFLRKINLEP